MGVLGQSKSHYVCIYSICKYMQYVQILCDTVCSRSVALRSPELQLQPSPVLMCFERDDALMFFGIGIGVPLPKGPRRICQEWVGRGEPGPGLLCSLLRSCAWFIRVWSHHMAKTRRPISSFLLLCINGSTWVNNRITMAYVPGCCCAGASSISRRHQVQSSL